MYRLYKNEAINFSIVVGQDTALYHKENDQFSEAFVYFAGKLDLPHEAVVPETEITLPFSFVADDAFPLRDNVMKPYPNRQLTLDKEIFNYRLSRARNSVECSFGKISQMWRILLRQMDEQPDAATNVIKAITVLTISFSCKKLKGLLYSTLKTIWLSQEY